MHTGLRGSTTDYLGQFGTCSMGVRFVALDGFAGLCNIGHERFRPRAFHTLHIVRAVPTHIQLPSRLISSRSASRRRVFPHSLQSKKSIRLGRGSHNFQLGLQVASTRERTTKIRRLCLQAAAARTARRSVDRRHCQSTAGIASMTLQKGEESTHCSPFSRGSAHSCGTVLDFTCTLPELILSYEISHLP